MKQACSHLLAGLSLAAYLLANTHVGLVFAAHHNAMAESQDTAMQINATEPLTVGQCPHCVKRACSGAQTAQMPPIPPVSHHATASAEHTCHDGDDEAPCPCCPHNPSHSCPAGCTTCEVGKTACVATSTQQMQPGVIGGERVIDVSFTYLAPSHIGLMRPPRINASV
jgi:hypothetical protein